MIELTHSASREPLDPSSSRCSPGSAPRDAELAAAPDLDGACDACMREEVEEAIMGLAALRLLSIHHRRASFSDLDRFSLGPEQADALREQLEARGISAIILATCNRTELYWRSRGNGDDLAVEACFELATGLAAPTELLQREDGERAALHLFRVASGLDSLLVGETEILGQVSDALAKSGRDGFVAGVFRAAVRCGRYARAETEISAGALSVASAAVRRLAAAVGDLSRRTVLVVGAGSTGLKVARHLRKMGVGRLILVNRTIERARNAAPSLNAEAASLEELAGRLVEADAVVVASHAPAPLVMPDLVARAQRGRADRPLVLLDLSMPLGIDPSVAKIPGVTLHDLSDLEELVNENLERRRLEIPKVEAVIERELGLLRAWARHEIVRPILSELRMRAEKIRQAELERLAGVEAIDCETVDRLTRRLIERLLSIPATIAREDRHPVLESCGFRCLGLMGDARDERA